MTRFEILKFRVGRWIRRVLHFFPSSIPQGVKEWETWSSDIIQTWGFPNNDSVRFSLAVMIMHDEPRAAYRRKWYFVRQLKKGAANQVANYVIQEAKAKQAAEQKAAQERSKAEATALSAAASNGTGN